MILPKASSRLILHNKKIVCLLNADTESAQLASLQKTIMEWIEDEQISGEAQPTSIFQGFNNFEKKREKCQVRSQKLFYGLNDYIQKVNTSFIYRESQESRLETLTKNEHWAEWSSGSLHPRPWHGLIPLVILWSISTWSVWDQLFLVNSEDTSLSEVFFSDVHTLRTSGRRSPKTAPEELS